MKGERSVGVEKTRENWRVLIGRAPQRKIRYRRDFHKIATTGPKHLALGTEEA